MGLVRTLVDCDQEHSEAKLPQELRELYDGDLHFDASAEERPFVMANFVSALDGVASYNPGWSFTPFLASRWSAALGKRCPPPPKPSVRNCYRSTPITATSEMDEDAPRLPYSSNPIPWYGSIRSSNSFGRRASGLIRMHPIGASPSPQARSVCEGPDRRRTWQFVAFAWLRERIHVHRNLPSRS
jgi:hypothetical protein